MMSKDCKIGFIGCGHMGLAIARGAAKSEYVERNEIAVYDHNPENMELCRQERFTLCNNESEVCNKAHVILLGVKPQNIDEVLENLKECQIDCLLSIVTGISIEYIQNKLNNVPVIRAMPNTPLQINEGSTALCKSSNSSADDYDFVYQLFNALGTVASIPEDQMNNIITVHGSIPAYVYYFIDCLVKDAVKRGIKEDVAKELIAQTFIGSSKLLLSNKNKSIDSFIDEVCSKGGTTIEAINTLKDHNVEEAIHDANENCIKRAKELSK